MLKLPRRPLARLALLGVGLLLLIQLIPVWLAQTNPPVAAEPAWDSPETRELAQRACFDCHSNETVWPWYSKVAPVSWLVTRDVLGGRSHLNLSEWGAATAEHRHAEDPGEAAAEVVRAGEMPLPIYVPLHPQADLTEAEREQLAQGLLKTLSAAP